MIYEFEIDGLREGDGPNLVGLLSVLACEGIRMRAKSIHLQEMDEAGVIKYEFESGRSGCDYMSKWLNAAIRESWTELMPRVVRELQMLHGLSARFVDNRLLVSNSKCVQTTIELVV